MTMNKIKNKRNTTKQITQGGMRVPTGQRLPDVVLQMPEIFLFDMKAYMSSVTMAKSIDYSCRTRLFDMYESALLDLHLSGVLAKRLRGVTRFPIEFQRNGEPDDTMHSCALLGSGSCARTSSWLSSGALPSCSSTSMKRGTYAMTSLTESTMTLCRSSS